MRKEIATRRHERGQTILIVAISLLSLLAMSALAIDVVTLYVAKSEIQRGADAVALAAARGIADSGVTTLPAGDPNLTDAKTLAQNLATAQINAVLNATTVNLVAGVQPTLVGTPTIDWTGGTNNPRITVALQSTNLPTFFARIWGSRSIVANASATAEAYNPANMATFTPIAPRSVKPWLVANSDPSRAGTPQFINPATGAVVTGATSVIGEQFNLTADCGPLAGCSLIDPTPRAHAPLQVDYVPAQVTASTSNVCPSTCLGATDYEHSIECADANSYAYLSCGGGASNITWDNSVNPGGGTGLSATAAECLIHATGTGSGQGQDTLNNASRWPDRPMTITAGSGAHSGFLVSTSNSVVTIPIIDTTPPFPASGQPLTVVGFLQAFINQVQGSGGAGTTAGDIQITVLNIAGCSSSDNGANPIVSSVGTSPVAVRLITPP